MGLCLISVKVHVDGSGSSRHLPSLPMFCPVWKIASQRLVTSYADLGRTQRSMRTVKLLPPFSND